MDLETLYRRTVEGWTARVEAVGPDQWAAPTPCEDWDVRTLVNHVVGEDAWTEPHPMERPGRGMARPGSRGAP